MKYSMKYMAMSLLVIASLGLTACGAGQVEKSETSVSSSVVTENTATPIKVGMLSIDDVLPLVVADTEGLFKEAGLDVQLFPFKSSSEQSQAMEAGELDVVMNDMIVQGLMKKSDTDTRVISYAFGATPQEGRFVVVASPNSGITKPEDLYGKKVAISNNTMMDFLMEQYEKDLGMDGSKIEKVNMPDLMLRVDSLLAGKDIQAAILPDPLASFAIQKGAIPVIDDTKLKDNYSQSVILVTTGMLKERKDDVDKFIKVYFKAMNRINENPDQYRALALQNARVPDSLKDEYKMPTFTTNQVPTPQEVERVTQWLKERKLVEKPYTYDEMIDSEFVKGK